VNTTRLNSSSWAIDTVDYNQAFRSIQCVAWNFSKRQREEIFDRVFRILISKELPSSMVVVDKINLLTRLVEHISHPLVLLQPGLVNIEDVHHEDSSNKEAPLIVLADKLDNGQGTEVSIALLLALKHLAEATIKYVILEPKYQRALLKESRHCISKSTHTQSAEILVSFYRTLVGRLGDDFEPSRNHAFASLLSVSLNIISQCMGKIPEPFLTEFSSLPSFQLLHIDGLYGVIKNIFENTRDLEEPDTRKKLGVTLEIMASYSGLFSDLPNVEQSKLFDRQGPQPHTRINYGY
jgi:hypothetical protein